ncbi:unnamed protein product [marine sediment metagenome]|uniref:Uncharacterized protein n=1 Tax=marine sediment metagenome TaxID=412755 RepID=X0RZ48_9ZZZZ
MSNKIGTYNGNNSFALPWKTKPKNSSQDKRKKIKPIVNPIFEKCAGLTEDKFWIAIFMECARGKFPRGFTFKNHLLTHKKGNKITRLELSKSPSDVYSSSKEFFSKMGGIMSQEDLKRLQKLEDERLAEALKKDRDISWKQVKTEKMKDILICEFIKDISDSLNFDEEERKELSTTIKKGFIMKYFKNIHMEDGRISEIDGLIYNGRGYEIDPKYTRMNKKKKSVGLGIELEERIEVNFLDAWEKYLEGLESKKVNRNHTYSTSTTNESDEFTKSY